MDNTPDIWQFLEANKQTLQEYFELKIELFNLKFIRKSSSIGALIIWLLILAFCILIILIFAGITLGFYLSSLCNSYVQGFAATTGIFVFITMLLILVRKYLFINPIIRIMVREQTKEHEEE